VKPVDIGQLELPIPGQGENPETELVRKLQVRTVRGREASEAGDPSRSWYCKSQWFFPYAMEVK